MIIDTVIPPWLFQHKGKTYLMPIWKEVPVGFDISQVKRKIDLEERHTPETHKVVGSRGDIYTVTKDIKGNWSCNCWGYKRAKDGKCKHIKSIINGQLSKKTK
jgi:hypothetical protein